MHGSTVAPAGGSTIHGCQDPVGACSVVDSVDFEPVGPELEPEPEPVAVVAVEPAVAVLQSATQFAVQLTAQDDQRSHDERIVVEESAEDVEVDDECGSEQSAFEIAIAVDGKEKAFVEERESSAE